MTESRPPVPPFDNVSAAQIVRMAEGAWNTRDPDRVFLVYIPNTQGRNRVELPHGRSEVNGESGTGCVGGSSLVPSRPGFRASLPSR